MNDNIPATRTATEIALIRAQTATVTRLLLGQGKMSKGVVISGGDRLVSDRQTALAETANASNVDLVHLEFGYRADGDYGLVGIVLICPRDGGCHILTDCQLYVGKPGTRALILPQSQVCGAFRLAKRELMHLLVKPDDAAAGVAHADKLVAAGGATTASASTRFQLLDMVAR